MNEKTSVEKDNTADAKLQQERRGGTKLDKGKSKFAKDLKPDEPSFEERATAAVGNLEEQKNQAALLVKHFWSVLKDKKLEKFKGPVEVNTESSLIVNLINFGKLLNNDDTQEESAGSMALIALLLKTIIMFKNEKNELTFRVSELEEKVKKLSSQGDK